MAGKLIKIGAACMVIGLFGYLVLPLAWWSLAHPVGSQFPCNCGEHPVERFAGPGGAPPGYICIAATSRVAQFQGPPLLPNEVRASLCDVGIIFGASFVLAVIGTVALLTGVAARRGRARMPTG
jgi:hypothetical protein